MRPKLFLFDIDGTLVTGVNDSTLTVNSRNDRFIEAIKNVTGVSIKRKGDFRGLTDQLILKTMLRGIGWDDIQIERAIPKLLVELDNVHRNNFHPETIQLLPGVKELLIELSQRKQVLGLLTGNLQPTAKRKLEALGIWSYFTVGGFGTDVHATRADLVTLAIGRAGFQNHTEDVFLIGDTSRDIEAGLEAGLVHTVGVINGFRNPKELKDMGASIVFGDLADTRDILQAFGLLQQ